MRAETVALRAQAPHGIAYVGEVGRQRLLRSEGAAFWDLLPMEGARGAPPELSPPAPSATAMAPRASTPAAAPARRPAVSMPAASGRLGSAEGAAETSASLLVAAATAALLLLRLCALAERPAWAREAPVSAHDAALAAVFVGGMSEDLVQYLIVSAQLILSRKAAFAWRQGRWQRGALRHGSEVLAVPLRCTSSVLLSDGQVLGHPVLPQEL
eukprot:CAMPEP_0175486240 /NCGR_PEP_ID=MMETSP0095-20121207/80938_1 /TAXON_ID=311494 /ORGANISM="Alexandrium monilatum, Strain CCMP3105" /LENGTH=212 /DNA_ID=CAMNT_0016788047 /DNA_START=1 /DNA_END=641 /DNA_ORIENTATION=+